LDIGVHCVHAQDDSSKVIKTQDLQITDSSGNTVADLATDDKDDTPTVKLYDSKGNTRLLIGCDTDGSGRIASLDTSGDPSVLISGGGDGSGLFLSRNKALKVMLTDYPDGSSGLVFNDNNEKDRVDLIYAEPKQTAGFFLYDKAHKQSVAMALDPSGAGVGVTDKKGITRVDMSCLESNGPVLEVDDKNGNPFWKQTDKPAKSGAGAHKRTR